MKILGKTEKNFSSKLSVEQADEFFNMFNIDVNTLRVPFITNRNYNGHDRWFENLQAIPYNDSGEILVKFIGDYVIQSKFGRINKEYYPFEVEGKLNS